MYVLFQLCLICVCIRHAFGIKNDFWIVAKLANKICPIEDKDFESTEPSFLTCAYKCLRNPTCHSTFYEVGSTTCTGCTGTYESKPQKLDHYPGTVHATMRIDCGEPDAVMGSEVVASPDTEYGANATYSCAIGYEATWDAVNRTCQDDETWSGSTPSCTIVDCGKPVVNKGTTVSLSADTVYGAAVSYACEYGYNTLTDPWTRTCQADGTWENAPPTCTPVDCGPPGDTTIKAYPDTTYGATATCANGHYFFAGDRTRTCQANGMWSGTSQQCFEVYCSSPDWCTNFVDDVRLCGEFNSCGIGRGRVEIIFDPVCKTPLTEQGIVAVTCNMFGYRSGTAYSESPRWDTHVFSEISCTGSETTLKDCYSEPTTSCDDVLGVECY